MGGLVEASALIPLEAASVGRDELEFVQAAVNQLRPTRFCASSAEAESLSGSAEEFCQVSKGGSVVWRNDHDDISIEPCEEGATVCWVREFVDAVLLLSRRSGGTAAVRRVGMTSSKGTCMGRVFVPNLVDMRRELGRDGQTGGRGRPGNRARGCASSADSVCVRIGAELCRWTQR
jgi:hypothetical protein